MLHPFLSGEAPFPVRSTSCLPRIIGLCRSVSVFPEKPSCLLPYPRSTRSRKSSDARIPGPLIEYFRRPSLSLASPFSPRAAPFALFRALISLLQQGKDRLQPPCGQAACSARL